ncbi:YbaY family lipoprotein [Pseudomonas sp. 5P_3.1_Bac2]|uniref:YbaY family lipoprotein n=1 Tax=Pseudomonas sp. 5P_3.1_Bac2 TaxID=2971617 RepID=UPI0021C9FC80|nr:YbaY family lipoprotein [Pseudomonas sp. 5P_3.1_Bac2]MCU1719339.1 YbaY family lipoprotein [Pseudomonas sp. 5P_3.1_Bac2]
MTNRFNPLPHLLLAAAVALLGACASDSPEPEAVASSPAPVADTYVLPANLHEITGSLVNVPAGAEVELALLGVDLRGRPRTELGNLKLRSNGQPLTFHLPFSPESFAKQPRIELHGRANKSGQLILRLTPKTIANADSQNIGVLHLVTAP